jgi:glycosyltransferase involved in cell wall biosynthesis
LGAYGQRVLGLSGRPLRVLRVIGRLNMGGPAHQASLLSGRRFDPGRYETLLVYGSLADGEESLADLAEDEGATTRFIPQLRQSVQPIEDLRALLKLIQIARKFKPHIVHTHTAKAGFLGRMAALCVRPRPAIVHTYHGHVLQGYFGTAKSRLYLDLERILAHVSDCLIGVSQATVDDLVNLGVANRDRFRVVRLGLDLDRDIADSAASRSSMRAELRIDTDDVLLVFVGRIVPIKRLDLLIEALAQAMPQNKHLRLAIVGDGPTRAKLEMQANSLGIGNAMRFLGYQRELALIYSAADIAVLSSANEGTPVSLIEAASAGVPAVATDVGGVREVVTSDTGIIVRPGDSAVLADAFLRMAADDSLRELAGRAAQSHALSQYRVTRLLSDIENLYRELAARKRKTDFV